jgi:hypothetical protein
MNEQTICEDEALLLAYAAGSLDEEQSGRVAQHVGRCAKCQEAVQGNEALIRVYRVFQKHEVAHPSSETLVQLVQDPAETSELVAARAHVDVCSECLDVISVLQRVETDLDRESDTESKPGFWRKWLTAARASHWLASPLPAYVLVLLLLYPAYVGLIGSSGRLDSFEEPALLSPPVALESGRERGAEVPRLHIDRSGRHRVVTFFVPIAPQRYRYRVELTRRGERIFYADEARSFDGIGTFALLLPEGTLESGSYTLRVEEVDKQSRETANVIEFVFELVS